MLEIVKRPKISASGEKLLSKIFDAERKIMEDTYKISAFRIFSLWLRIEPFLEEHEISLDLAAKEYIWNRFGVINTPEFLEILCHYETIKMQKENTEKEIALTSNNWINILRHVQLKIQKHDVNIKFAKSKEKLARYVRDIFIPQL